MVVRVVLDTNVIISALRSQRGASASLLRRVGTTAFEHVISVALMLEYEAVCTRRGTGLQVEPSVIEDVLDYLAATGHRQPIHFHWRPTLPDPADDHVLDLAVAAGAAIVTYNHRHFVGAERFRVPVISPAELLRRLPPEDLP